MQTATVLKQPKVMKPRQRQVKVGSILQMHKRTFSKIARAKGYRSGLEEKVASELNALGIKFSYEPKGLVIPKKD